MTQYKIPLPTDVHNRDVQAGLGIPVLIDQKTITASSFGTSYEAINYSGDNEGRNYRHMAVYNLTGDAAIVIGFSNNTSSATESIKVPSGFCVVFDTILFGPNNNISYIHFKIHGGTTATVDVVYW